MASVPQVKGPWLWTSTAGMVMGSMPWNVSMMTLPVLQLVLPAISAGVIFRVQGMSP